MKLSSLLHPRQITCDLAARTKGEPPVEPLWEMAVEHSRNGARGAQRRRGRRLVGTRSAGESLQKVTGSP